jgi:hypothetical protein
MAHRDEQGRIIAHEVWDGNDWDDAVDNGDGYFHVKRPDYPGGNQRTGWARRSHVVWWLKTGQVVPSGWHIHHKDRDIQNDVFENLQLASAAEHMRTHGSPPQERVCKRCGRTFLVPQHVINSNGDKKYCPSNECPARVPKHGTVRSYSYWGCRCDLCRAAIAAYARELRARKK